MKKIISILCVLSIPVLAMSSSDPSGDCAVWAASVVDFIDYYTDGGLSDSEYYDSLSDLYDWCIGPR